MTLADQTEQAIRAHRVRMERRLYELVGQISQKSRKDPVWVMRMCTSYKRPDGSIVAGLMRPELIRSDERLERSVKDAEMWLEKLHDSR